MLLFDMQLIKQTDCLKYYGFKIMFETFILQVSITIVIRIEYIKGIHTSILTFLFWITLLLAEIFPLRFHTHIVSPV